MFFGKKSDGNGVPGGAWEVFTIFDTKTGSYEFPSYAMNSEDIVRQLLNMFRDPSQAQNKFKVNAEDYSLFRIGFFSKRPFFFETLKSPEHIANLHDLKALIASEHRVTPSSGENTLANLHHMQERQ